jgi:hypothetical protein
MYVYYIVGFGTVYSATIHTDVSEERTAYIFCTEDKRATSINLPDVFCVLADDVWSVTCCLLHGGFILGLIFNPECGGMYHRNVR